MLDFSKLFSKHCAGCHGQEGRLGPAPPLNDPLFLAIVPDEALRQVLVNGRSMLAIPHKGKGADLADKSRGLMPAFAKANGGPLTEAQIDVLIHGMRERWGQASLQSPNLPPYRLGKAMGNAEAGKKFFAVACAGCHGTNGEGGKDAGPLNDSAFLALISDQALRRIVITGRPDLGMPDYRTRGDRPPSFQPLTSQEIADLVALLASWRSASDGS